MAVITLPTGFEDLPNNIGQLGHALTQVMFPGRMKDMQTERLIRERPEIGMKMARAVRIGGSNALAASGVSPELAAKIAEQFPADLAEQVEITLMNDPNFLASVIAARKQEPQVALAQGGTTIAKADLEAEQIGHIRQQDLPRLSALVQNGQLQMVGRELAAVERLGLVEKRLIAESQKIDVESAQGKFVMQNIEEYNEFANSLPAHLKGIAKSALVNPGLAQHILAHEQMDFEVRLSNMKAAAAAGTPELSLMEAWKVAGDMRERINSGLDRLRAANEEGNEDDRRAAIADLQNTAAWHRQLVSEGTLPPGNVITGDMKERWIRSGLAKSEIEEPQVNLDWVKQGLTQHAALVEAGVLPKTSSAIDLLQQSRPWFFLSKAQQQKLLADVQAGREPTLLQEEGERATSSESATAPTGARPTPEQRGVDRAAIAQRIAVLQAVPAAQRTQEQTRELIGLVDKMRFGGIAEFLQGSGPSGRPSVTGGTR